MTIPGTLPDDFQPMREYFNSGITIEYDFRKQQLFRLREALQKYEPEIAAALKTDLNKGPEESFASETGLLQAEILFAVKQLRRWMTPKRVGVSLVNMPSSGRIYHDPLGVVLIIAPWNYPVQLLLVPLVGAIAAGNCVVLKPSELAGATEKVLEKLILETFDPAFIRLITGEGKVVVPHTIRNFRFDHIFYTGGYATGKSIYQLAAEQLIPVTLELGGKSPAIVAADANLAIACRRIAIGKFLNAGQTCVAPDYVVVDEKIKEPFISLLKATISDFYEANADPSGYGRIINEARFDKLIALMDDGVIVAGGGHDRGAVTIQPTLLENVNPDAEIMKQEIFGPILPILTYRNSEEALAIVNRNPDPLAFYLFTSDKKIEKWWMQRLRFGGGCINNTIWQLANKRFPFGGIGNSGLGAYHGHFTFKLFSHAKAVMRTPLWPDPAIKYPPFAGKLKWFKLFIK